MNYEEAKTYIEELPKESGRSEVLTELGKKLGVFPFPVTVLEMEQKAKGTAFFLAAILKAAGYKVGLWPAAVPGEERERLHRNGATLPKNSWCRYVEQLREVCGNTVFLTREEATFLIALMAVSEKPCDYFICEKGLFSKWGWKAERTLRLEKERAAQTRPVKVRTGLERQRFSWKTYEQLEISLSGNARIEEAAEALEWIGNFGETEWKVRESAIRKGLQETRWEGHLKVCEKKPLLLAHMLSGNGADEELADFLEAYAEGKRVHLILGLLREDPYEEWLEGLLPYVEQVLTVTPREEGALSSYELASAIYPRCFKVTALDSVEEALEIGRLMTGKDSVLVAAGAGSMIKHLLSLVAKK